MARIHAERARRLIGARFRPQGRNPATGLDCIGVVLHAHRIPPALVRSDYGLRGGQAELEQALATNMRRVGNGRARVGDVLLLQLSANQVHVAVRTEGGFIHAHAGLRRVVETPGEPPWRLIGIYRHRKTR